VLSDVMTTRGMQGSMCVSVEWCRWIYARSYTWAQDWHTATASAPTSTDHQSHGCGDMQQTTAEN